ncbi:MAG: 4-hydroxy-3-methylbut-2-enyl diphosphate reductase [candidate division WOR-3 bacterium]|nr:4-hydroxy-3-methylbut-2-enyl diphosphate reductase [candidate division WOR-3 bacterium]MDW7988286.1 4-hydroxy-3-methylbut-2-enyl diphosphate reductase [candidate division WOR-3 bacterium]
MPKIKVVFAKPLGFCFGVKRALRLTLNARKKTKAGPVITFGELIHNPQVLSELRRSGIVSVENLNELSRYNVKDNPAVVIRSHGCAPEIKEAIKKMGFNIIDATCPTVRRVSKFAQVFSKKGYFVVIVGNKDHPEVKGILGHVKDQKCIAVYHAKLPQILRRNEVKKLVLLAQTTITKEEFLSAIKKFDFAEFDEIKIINTLCKEAQLRQRSCQNLKNHVELIIVIGGRNSANTKSLYKLASGARSKVIQITKSQELIKNKVVRKMLSESQHELKVGIISGASTPIEAVAEVVTTIKALAQETPAGSGNKFFKSHFKEVINNNEC